MAGYMEALSTAVMELTAVQAKVNVLDVGVLFICQVELSRLEAPVVPTMCTRLPTRRPCANVVVTVAVIPLSAMALVAAGNGAPV